MRKLISQNVACVFPEGVDFNVIPWLSLYWWPLLFHLVFVVWFSSLSAHPVGKSLVWPGVLPGFSAVLRICFVWHYANEVFLSHVVISFIQSYVSQSVSQTSFCPCSRLSLSSMPVWYSIMIPSPVTSKPAVRRSKWVFLEHYNFPSLLDGHPNLSETCSWQFLSW